MCQISTKLTLTSIQQIEKVTSLHVCIVHLSAKHVSTKYKVSSKNYYLFWLFWVIREFDGIVTIECNKFYISGIFLIIIQIFSHAVPVIRSNYLCKLSFDLI